MFLGFCSLGLNAFGSDHSWKIRWNPSLLLFPIFSSRKIFFNKIHFIYNLFIHFYHRKKFRPLYDWFENLIISNLYSYYFWIQKMGFFYEFSFDCFIQRTPVYELEINFWIGSKQIISWSLFVLCIEWYWCLRTFLCIASRTMSSI